MIKNNSERLTTEYTEGSGIFHKLPSPSARSLCLLCSLCGFLPFRALSLRGTKQSSLVFSNNEAPEIPQVTYMKIRK